MGDVTRFFIRDRRQGAAPTAADHQMGSDSCGDYAIEIRATRSSTLLSPRPSRPISPRFQGFSRGWFRALGRTSPRYRFTTGLVRNQGAVRALLGGGDGYLSAGGRPDERQEELPQGHGVAVAPVGPTSRPFRLRCHLLPLFLCCRKPKEQLQGRLRVVDRLRALAVNKRDSAHEASRLPPVIVQPRIVLHLFTTILLSFPRRCHQSRWR